MLGVLAQPLAEAVHKSGLVRAHPAAVTQPAGALFLAKLATFRPVLAQFPPKPWIAMTTMYAPPTPVQTALAYAPITPTLVMIITHAQVLTPVPVECVPPAPMYWSKAL